jgi:polysaccharide biosynthesis/export protein
VVSVSFLRTPSSGILSSVPRLPAASIAIPALLSCVMLLTGCADKRGGSIPYEVKSFSAPDAPAVVSLEEGYKIAPLDTLKVTVYRVPDMSGDYEVDLTGNVAMPLIGNVQAVNKTTSELRADLIARYHPNYLTNPDIAIGVKASSRHSVTVDGAVAQPGMYPATGPMTLMQAVALARGTTENANPRRVAVFRQIKGQRMAAAFDLTSIRRGEAEDPKIYTGDIIVVDGSNNKLLQRQLLQAIPILNVFNPLL